jgi:hypothetical protein
MIIKNYLLFLSLFCVADRRLARWGGGGWLYPIPTTANKEIFSVLFLSMTKLIPEGEEGADCNEESEKRDGVTWN